jgi:putative oxidoreductase
VANSRNFKQTIISTLHDNRTIIIRIIIGLIFLSEGIQKYLFPELVGTGGFEKIGFAHPAFLAYFIKPKKS